jgi:hypothetical protein
MNDLTTEAPKRPTMLTILCILSLLFNLFALWGGYKTAFTDAPTRDLEEARAKLDEAMEQMGEEAGAGFATFAESTIDMHEHRVENAKPLGYTGIALALLSLGAVWLMWNLKKMGFWAYLVASVAGLIPDALWLGGGSAAVVALAMMSVITLVFVILYAVNLKHMR